MDHQYKGLDRSHTTVNTTDSINSIWTFKEQRLPKKRAEAAAWQGSNPNMLVLWKWSQLMSAFSHQGFSSNSLAIYSVKPTNITKKCLDGIEGQKKSTVFLKYHLQKAMAGWRGQWLRSSTLRKFPGNCRFETFCLQDAQVADYRVFKHKSLQTPFCSLSLRSFFFFPLFLLN